MNPRASTSWASSPATLKSMQANRSRDTTFELAVRRIVFARGLRYRVDARPEPTIPRRADMVFRRDRVAVFLDGCFWHGCPDHYTSPERNAAFWARKIETNRARDLDTTARLTHAGWLVLRFWEHEPRAWIADEIISALAQRAQDG